MFTLTKFPNYGASNDSYNACGKCQGINRLYPLSQWTCSKPADIKNNTITVFMDIYEHCDFKWKWRNLAYDENDPKAHEFDNDERTFNIGAGCGEGMITKVETEWEKHRDKVIGKCVRAPPQIIKTTELTSSITYPRQITTENQQPERTTIFQTRTNTTTASTDSTASTTSFTDQSAGSPPSEVVSETATKDITASTRTSPGATLTSTAGLTVTQLSTTFNPASISSLFIPQSTPSTIPVTTTKNTENTTSKAFTMTPELQTTDAITQIPSSSSTVSSSGKPNSMSNQPNSNINTSNHPSHAVTATETNEATTLTVTTSRASQTEQGKIQRSTRPSNSSLSGSGVLLLYKKSTVYQNLIYHS